MSIIDRAKIRANFSAGVFHGSSDLVGNCCKYFRIEAQPNGDGPMQAVFPFERPLSILCRNAYCRDHRMSR